jgi:endonuclease G
MILGNLSYGQGKNFWYLPTSTTKTRIVHTYYTVSYSVPDKEAEWVSYMLTRERALSEKVTRKNNFRKDPQISKSASANPNDYKKTGYDRGHLAPAGDMRFDSVAMSESFYLTNISPQLPDFNRGIWQRVEQQVRNWAVDYDTIYIATGGVLKDPMGKLGESKITIPKYFYKVVLDYKNGETKAIAFLLPNMQGGKKLRQYTVTIDSVEKMTGIDFFPGLPDNIENRVESTVDTTLWKWDVSPEPRKYYSTKKVDYSESDITIKPSNAMEYIGEKVNVTGVIAQVSETANVIYLNMGGPYPNNSFSGQIYRKNAGLFNDLASYSGKKVSITGKIKEYNGKPLIIIDSPEQIRFI